MSKVYRVKKGAKLIPFSFREKVDALGYISDHEWSVVSSYEGEPLFAQDDWYFTEDRLLPFDYENYPKRRYVRLPRMTTHGNAFMVLQSDVEEVDVEKAINEWEPPLGDG